MQKAVETFMKKQSSKEIYIQKHPKDYAEYPIAQQYIIYSSTPKEVTFPVFFTSSVIENFTLFNRESQL
jgi:hypothetical protein